MRVNNSKNNKDDITEIYIIYNIENKEYIDIFGYNFVINNKKYCKMLIDNKEYEIKCHYNVEKYKNNILKIKLKGINNVTNMSFMFYGCSSLLSLPDISKWKTNNVTNMSCMFYGCSSLPSLPDISKWNTNNAIYMNNMSYECSLLSSLPDILKWNINNEKI